MNRSYIRMNGLGHQVVFQGIPQSPRFVTEGAAKASLTMLLKKKRKPEPEKKVKQSSRMLKCECPTCGYVARTTRYWIKERGTPACPDHGAMVCME